MLAHFNVSINPPWQEQRPIRFDKWCCLVAHSNNNINNNNNNK